MNNYGKAFKKEMIKLNYDYKTDDTRYSTTPYLKICDVSYKNRKIISDHKFINDVLSNVYTHLSIDYLLNCGKIKVKLFVYYLYVIEVFLNNFKQFLLKFNFFQ